MNMKQYIFPISAAVVIVAMVMNERQTDSEHHAFFKDVREFISAGGRNTAEDGYTLCEALNEVILETETNTQTIDCSKYLLDREVPDLPLPEGIE